MIPRDNYQKAKIKKLKMPLDPRQNKVDLKGYLVTKLYKIKIQKIPANNDTFIKGSRKKIKKIIRINIKSKILKHNKKLNMQNSLMCFFTLKRLLDVNKKTLELTKHLKNT